VNVAEPISIICARAEKRDEQIHALVPEEGRVARLQREGAALAARYQAGSEKPPLFAKLVGIKDILHVDGLQTRAGSAVPAESLAGPEAVCVTALKEAGALVLAKTVTAEFAYFEPGPTCNPHNPAHTPGGSSSGSAAAVAAGFCPLALGTQTVGSVIRPAAFCGVIGFKPSYGRVSTQGLLYYSPSVDTVGWFARSLEMTSLAASILCGDWRDIDVWHKPVIGIPEGPYLGQATAEGMDAFYSEVSFIEAAGFVVKRVPLFADIEEIDQSHTRLITGEVAREHAERFAEYGDLYRPRTAALVRAGLALDDGEIEQAREGRGHLRSEISSAMLKHDIDMWICPAAKGAAPKGLNSTGDPAMNLPWTYAGLPTLALPAGRAINGLPLGLQCVTAFGADEELLEWGGELEKVLQHECGQGILNFE
jgi:Asp-tRNA(Asn)/Glu-tRNA(Gln) amidotransferase A subunit family amidase